MAVRHVPQVLERARPQVPIARVSAHHVAVFRDRLPNGLCLASVVTESGDEDWHLVCPEHRWVSIGGPQSEALRAVCCGCEAQEEARRRRVRFMRAHGSLALVALFEGQN